MQFLWFVDPQQHVTEAFQRAESGGWLRLAAWAGEEKARIAPFDAIELELAPLWVTKLEE